MTFTLREMGAADVAPAHLLSQKISGRIGWKIGSKRGHWVAG